MIYAKEKGRPKEDKEKEEAAAFNRSVAVQSGSRRMEEKEDLLCGNRAGARAC